MATKKETVLAAVEIPKSSVPSSGGSYIRNADGSLKQIELATEAALPEAGEPVAEAAADQPEQE